MQGRYRDLLEQPSAYEGQDGFETTLPGPSRRSIIPSMLMALSDSDAEDTVPESELDYESFEEIKRITSTWYHEVYRAEKLCDTRLDRLKVQNASGPISINRVKSLFRDFTLLMDKYFCIVRGTRNAYLGNTLSRLSTGRPLPNRIRVGIHAFLEITKYGLPQTLVCMREFTDAIYRTVEGLHDADTTEVVWVQ